MRHIKAIVLTTILALMFLGVSAQVERIDPPYWWVGMKNGNLQLLVSGKSLASLEPRINQAGITLEKVSRFENANYLALDIAIAPDMKATTFNIEFLKNGKKTFVKPYTLKARANDTKTHQGFNSQDVVYLIMPDRFSNGDPSNDNIKGMEQLDRKALFGRHGGDIQGLINHIDYFKNLGVTSVWLNPVQENDQPVQSYHGYAITDLYRIDRRFGSNDLYFDFVRKSHDKGLKVIMDMVFNHIGTNTYFVKDLPSKDWLNYPDTKERSNFRGEVISDPHASVADREKMCNGWFDGSMADLNQCNPFVYRYLVQSSIWWIEAAGLDGIRMDTYPYPDKNAMASWIPEVMSEYPNINIVGECWLQTVPATAYWQNGGFNRDGYQSTLRSITDFPLYNNLAAAFREKTGWGEGLARLYTVLTQDNMYANPNDLLVFPDNHDLTRLYTSLGGNLDWWKQAIAFVLTTRGIPQIYYGTEYLDHNNEGGEHGYIRKDFPGGWAGDTVNVATGKGLSAKQAEAMKYMTTLLNWRKTSEAVGKGKLTQFIPDGDTYTYFKTYNGKAVMVVLNNGDARKLELKRFNEILKDFKGGRDVATGDAYSFEGGAIDLKGHNALILDLK
ncbi:glycoside hydrolase family 13 protein [uncultured Acetobacteroides sp.]|uniref:glycoside hydrolase family 13 protein n=1 Tax=uncultured Acetobacteroides sp. TaxID=1760811 RepID=UPI0029F5B3C9|nr:glycoside hydrolase family 13 protein [uncultured Acetobacteroides sp.]